VRFSKIKSSKETEKTFCKGSFAKALSEKDTVIFRKEPFKDTTFISGYREKTEITQEGGPE
jgi:hypothetical protein